MYQILFFMTSDCILVVIYKERAEQSLSQENVISFEKSLISMPLSVGTIET
jgi:DNA-binding PucR family transcriptional regulator